MTTCPTFLEEFQHQVAVARAEHAAARKAHDESAVDAAAARIADLLELAARQTPEPLRQLVLSSASPRL